MISDSHQESEWRTRKSRIDRRLVAQGWTIVHHREVDDFSTLQAHAVEELPTANGPADYALVAGGRLLGLIEAKKVTVNPQNVLEQAKRYARASDYAEGKLTPPGRWQDLRVPFLYSTNGEIVWHLDARPQKRVSRQVSDFHSPSALQDLFGARPDLAHQWLRDTPIDRIERLRPYQLAALSKIEESIMDGKRQFLVAMATGTGKTYTTVSQIYRLLESKLARRVLFLVDRKALAAQSVREFASFNTPAGNKFNQEYEVYSQRFRREDFGDDKPFDPKVLPTEYLTAPSSAHTFVYVSTIQRMAINLFGREAGFGQSASDPDLDDDAGRLDIPIHAFDLIIADECHRGYTTQEESVWRGVLNHFDCIKVGLTATPAAHTVALFGEPVYRYGVEQAIKDGFLVDYDSVVVRSEIRLQGVFLQEGDRVGRVDTVTGEETYDELEDTREFPAGDLERTVTAPDSNKKIIQEVAKYAYEHEEKTGRFPKILIFAANDVPHTSHADQLVRICREVFAQGDEFVQKITGNANVDRPLQRIREFRNRPNPRIVVTVDMLSTGVDIPALEFIVFLRSVQSRILWEQMLGRGTRLCHDINKTHFTIFDCFDGTLIERFKNVSAFKLEGPQSEPVPVSKVIDNIWNNVEKDYNVRVLVKRLRRIEKDINAEAREAFSRFIPNGDIGAFAGKVPELLNKDFVGTMKVLRDEKFQKLLVQYPRARRQFLIAMGAEDEVSSEHRSRFGDYDRPEDYLEAFAGFVKERSVEIEALRILLERPKNWKPTVLEELRKILREANFNEPQLQDAHRAVYRKVLADIISMVKHAARDEEPILTAEERVGRAMDRILLGATYTEEQKEWLGYIREHMIANLTIEEEDFDVFPVFEQHGGVGRARRLFGDQLAPLIETLNQAVAA